MVIIKREPLQNRSGSLFVSGKSTSTSPSPSAARPATPDTPEFKKTVVETYSQKPDFWAGSVVVPLSAIHNTPKLTV